MILRDATAEDAAAIAALHAANWRVAYRDILDPAYLADAIDLDRLTVWQSRLAQPDPAQEVVVAEVAEHGLAGFTCLFHRHDPRWGGFIDNLHSSAAVRGTGVGKALIREAGRRIGGREPASGVWLWVFESNTPAVGFYQALGGTIVERSPSDWDFARDQIRLRCHWQSAAALAEL